MRSILLSLSALVSITMGEFYVLDGVNVEIDVPSYVKDVEVIGGSCLSIIFSSGGGIFFDQLSDEESKVFNKSSVITPESLLSVLMISNRIDEEHNLLSYPISINNSSTGYLKDGTPYAAIEYFPLVRGLTAEVVLYNNGRFFRFWAMGGLNVDTESKGVEFLRRAYDILESISFMDDISKDTMVVVVDALRIRDKPNTSNSNIIGMLHLNDTVFILEINNNWAKIKATDGTVGWSCITLGGEVYLK